MPVLNRDAHVTSILRYNDRGAISKPSSAPGPARRTATVFHSLLMTSDTRQSALLLEPTSSKSLSHARAAQEGVAISLPFLTRRRCGSYNGTRPPRRAPALHEHGAQPYKVGPRKRQIEVVVQSD